MRMINARARRSTAAATESSSSSEDGISPSDQEKHVGPALPDNHTHSHQHHHATDVDFSSPQAHMDVTSASPEVCLLHRAHADAIYARLQSLRYADNSIRNDETAN